MTLCRCGAISKPYGAPAGLVLISPSANLHSVRVDLRQEAARLARLEEQQGARQGAQQQPCALKRALKAPEDRI